MLLKVNSLHLWRWCTNSSQLVLTNGRNWVYTVWARGWELGQSWPFRTGPSCCCRFDKLVPKQKLTGSTFIPKIVQDAFKASDTLNEHLFTGAVVDNIEEDMVNFFRLWYHQHLSSKSNARIHVKKQRLLFHRVTRINTMDTSEPT